MAVTIQPKVAQILMCDFSCGFKEPEMVKNRPVVIIASGRPGLVTIVPLSTRTPNPVEQYHMELPRASLPQIGQFEGKTSWVKGDMVYTVGFHRLNLIRLGKKNPNTGKRVYYQDKLSRETMKKIYACVMHGLNLGRLEPHI